MKVKALQISIFIREILQQDQPAVTTKCVYLMHLTVEPMALLP